MNSVTPITQYSRSDSFEEQLGESVDSRRLVLTLSNFSALDVFDKNDVIGDLRRSFFDEAFMTNSAWDFPTDALLLHRRRL